MYARVRINQNHKIDSHGTPGPLLFADCIQTITVGRRLQHGDKEDGLTEEPNEHIVYIKQ